MTEYTQVDLLVDMTFAINFYDEVITFEDAKAFAIDWFLTYRGTTPDRPDRATPGCSDFDQYFDFLEEVSTVSGTWKNIRQMATTKAGTKKVLQVFLRIARRMENWAI